MTQLVILNGPSGDLVPDTDLETWVCNGNFLRRRYDHVVSFEAKRLKLIREHGCSSVWTKLVLLRARENLVDCNLFYDTGNAAIWSAAQRDQHIIIAGADAWMGADDITVCNEIYETRKKPLTVGRRWSGKFHRWSRSYPEHAFEFVWPEPVEGYKTLTVELFKTKYCCGR